LWFFEKVQMIVESSCDGFNGFGITALPAGLQSAEMANGFFTALGPEDGAQIFEDGFPVGRGDARFNVAQQVNDAELMSDAQQARDGGFDAFVFVGNDEAQLLNVHPAFEQILEERFPAVLIFAVAECKAEDMAAVLIVDA